MGEVGPDQAEIGDLPFKSLAAIIRTDCGVTGIQDEDMGKGMEPYSVRSVKYKTSGVEKRSAIHVFQYDLYSFRRVGAPPEGETLESACSPQRAAQSRSGYGIHDRAIDKLLAPAQPERVGTKVGEDGHDPTAPRGEVHVADHGEAERDSPEQVGSEAEGPNATGNVGAETAQTDIRERGLVGGEAREVNGVYLKSLPEEIDQSAEKDAVGIEGVDKDQVGFGGCAKPPGDDPGVLHFSRSTGCSL